MDGGGGVAIVGGEHVLQLFQKEGLFHIVDPEGAVLTQEVAHASPLQPTIFRFVQQQAMVFP